LINKLPNNISEIEKNTIEMIFQRIEKIINELI
jgi:hypothetical protein